MNKFNLMKFKNWLILLILYILFDIILQLTRATLWNFNIIVYIICLIFVTIQFYLIENIRRILPSTISILFVFIFNLWIAFISIGSFFVFNEFGDYITASKLQFNLSNPYYLSSYAKTYILNWNVIGLIIIAAIMTYLWLPVKKYRTMLFLKKHNRQLQSGELLKFIIKNIIMLLIMLISLFILFYVGERKKLTPDASFFVALYNGHKYQTEPMRQTDRIKVMPYIPKDSINILFIVYESWGKKALTSENGIKAMPFLDSLIKDTNQVVSLDWAYSQAGSTEISMPSMFSGVDAWESKHKLHSFPLIWDWAKAGGLKTIFISVQAYYWCDLDKFMTTPGPDDFLPVNYLGIPLLHDGADEIQVSNIFCDSLESFAKSGKNFLAIYNSNACHKPFQQESKFLKDKPQKIFKSAYRNACLLLDYSLRDFFNVLNNNDVLEKTLVIITGDHGETDSIIHQPLFRLYNYYDEILNVPMIIRLPKAITDKYPDAITILKKNKTKIVANIDILPSIIHILNADINEYNKILLSNLLGYNLFNMIPEDRISIGMTTNDIRKWEYEGFGIIWKNWRFVFSNIQNTGLYNIIEDSLQKNNLINNCPKDIRDFFENVINSNFLLKRIYERWKDS